MKCRVLFSLKNYYKKKIRMLSAAILLDPLKVNIELNFNFMDFIDV